MTLVSPAERLLVGLGIKSPSDIDLDVIAWTVGAVVKYRPLDGCEAFIIGQGGKAVIVVNDRSSPSRQRFSLGHELGHWHHHQGKLLFCVTADIGSLRPGPVNTERQADDFASDLIFPDYLFRSAIAGLSEISLEAVRQISDQFTASRTATMVRLAKSNKFPIVLVCHGKAGKRWSWPAKMVPGWWKLRSDLDVDSFAYDLLYLGKAEEDWPRKIGADAFFDFRGADRYEIREQSLRLPNDEILTVLHIPDDGLG